MMHRTSSSTWVKGIADMFASQGVDTPRLFRAARLDVGIRGGVVGYWHLYTGEEAADGE